MATRIPPVHALCAFEAAARFGSFAMAAEELCITPSALSHRIRLLEDMVGERLFLREGRAVTVSDFGRRYLDVVRQALRSLNDFPIARAPTPDPNRLKITVPPTFARYMLVPQLASFTALYPAIRVELYLSVPLYDLSLSESDLEVRFGAGNYPDLVSEKLFEEPAFAVASPDYLKRVGAFGMPADLQRASLIRSALEPWQPWFQAAGLDWPEPVDGIRVDDLGLLLELVKHGHGVGLTRAHFAREALERGEIVRLFDLQLSAPPHAYYMVYERVSGPVRDLTCEKPGDKPGLERPALNLFIDWMRRTFGNV